MELKWLEDFLSLAETRNFSRSAELRFTTQPAFSRRIKALEDWVGAILIDRSAQPVGLTGAGANFRSLAEEVVRQLYQGREEIHLASVNVAASSAPAMAARRVPRASGALARSRRGSSAYDCAPLSAARALGAGCGFAHRHIGPAPRHAGHSGGPRRGGGEYRPNG